MFPNDFRKCVLSCIVANDLEVDAIGAMDYPLTILATSGMPFELEA